MNDSLEKKNSNEEIEEGVPFFPKHFLKEIAVCFMLMALLFFMVSFLPPELGEKSDPFNTPEHIKPEWYFLSVYQYFKVVPEWIGIASQAVFMVFILLLPFIDRGEERHPLRRPVFLTLSLLGVALFLALTLWGYFS